MSRRRWSGAWEGDSGEGTGAGRRDMAPSVRACVPVGAGLAVVGEGGVAVPPPPPAPALDVQLTCCHVQRPSSSTHQPTDAGSIARQAQANRRRQQGRLLAVTMQRTYWNEFVPPRHVGPVQISAVPGALRRRRAGAPLPHGSGISGSTVVVKGAAGHQCMPAALHGEGGGSWSSVQGHTVVPYGCVSEGVVPIVLTCERLF